ncbi:dienelactone hydrolase family protein, partial [Rheinheimera soli]|uniref:dienelactone hydrolase family protein n=1 Tax=Rheinheimera soli TaxID=443616 RepID=UPI001E627904
MQLVIVTDIFGAQPEVLLQFDQLGSDYLCVQPYDHQPPVFADDKEAYQYFLDHGGIEAYCNKVGEVLKAQIEPVFLAGFSAGAAACWANLAVEHLTIKHCVGFYGGQIRQMTHLQPLYPTELIFAEESHFSVSELMSVLADKANVKQSLEPYPHGFMNVLSQGYRAEAAGGYW